MPLTSKVEKKMVLRSIIASLRTLAADTGTDVRQDERMIEREIAGLLESLATRNPNGLAVAKAVAITPSTPTARACTFTIASEDIGLVAHGYAAGDCVYFPTVVTTTGITAGTTPYFVIAAGLTADAFRVSATKGGSAVDLATGNGTGTVRLAALVTVDFKAGEKQYVTLAHNSKVVFTNAAAGGGVKVTFIQDATGSRLLSFGSTIQWAGGSAPTLTTTAAKADRLEIDYLNSVYYGQVDAANL